MSFPSYPRYQDAGSEWLGPVPEHWEVTKLSYISSRIGSGKTPTGGAEAYVPSGVVFIRSQNVHDDGLRLDDVVFISEATDKEMAWSRVKPLDVLLNITGASIGRTCLVPAGFGPANVNQHVCVIRLEQPETHAKWVALAMTSATTKSQVDVNQTGAAREGLNFEQVSGFQIAVPPIEERRQIANFLDHETAKIDALIREQERLIKLLQEKRQAVISHAVTKGLDPDVPMKDSGVEWLGEVPVRWMVAKLGYYAEINTGATPDRSNPEYWNGDIPWIKTGEVNYELITEAEEHITGEGVRNSAARIAPPGTMLMAMYGQGVTRGRVAILGTHAAYNQACAAIAPNRSLNVHFLRWFMIAAYPYVRDDGNETSQMNLSSSYISKIPLVVPASYAEQEEIHYFLEKRVRQFAELMGVAKHSMELLKERRSALISAAVTGKIDVRNWQPPADERAFDEEVRKAGLEATA